MINTKILKPKQEDPGYRKHLSEQVDQATDVAGLSTDKRFLAVVDILEKRYYADWKLSKDKAPEERERLFIKHEVLEELVDTIRRIEAEGNNAQVKLARL